jgi:hypothetical protein
MQATSKTLFCDEPIRRTNAVASGARPDRDSKRQSTAVATGSYIDDRSLTGGTHGRDSGA